MKFFCLACFVAKKGGENDISILSISLCMSAFLCLSVMSCLYFLLLHLFCIYFRLCVDVVMDVTIC